MPIYEFKCIECHEYFEYLFMNPEEKIELRCPKCKSPNIERVVSTTNFSVGNPRGKTGVTSQTRTCSSGSCTTYEIPGHTR